jgi:glycosyltransferase involved in cell wall biosynthesis
MSQLIQQMKFPPQRAGAEQAQRQRYSIAMATFNGEAYIWEQLNSLARQILLPYELVVCDDGSTDRTVNILQEFQKEAPFSVKIYENPRRLGFADNFLQTASKCSGDWVAFCDQDDIWFPEKLVAVDEAIKNSQVADLMLVTHSVQIASEDPSLSNGRRPHSPKARTAGPNTWSAAALGGVKTLHSRKDRTIGRNCHPGFWGLPGFTCVFRRELITCFDWKVRPKNYDGNYPLQPHDKWICMLANALGSVRHIAKPLVLYRRHDAALTGYYERKSVRARIGLSKPVGVEQYRFMAAAARESAAVLSALAQSAVDPRWSDNLTRSGMLFEKLASNCAMRAEMYGQKGSKKKFVSFMRLIVSQGYFGSAFCSLGMSSLLKDLVCCFAGQVFVE